MKTYFTLVCFLVCGITFSQEQFQIHNTKIENNFYRSLLSSNKVKSAEVISSVNKIVYKFDNEGKVTEINSYDVSSKSDPYIQIYKYDKSSNLVEITSGSKNTSTETFEWDKNGNMVLDKSELLTTKFFYDADNHIIKSEFTEQGTEANPIESAKYNVQGLKSDFKEVCWTGENNPNIYYRYKYEYDASAKLLKSTIILGNCKNNTEEVSSWVDYEYNSAGLPVKYTENYSVPAEVMVNTVQYEYYP